MILVHFRGGDFWFSLGRFHELVRCGVRGRFDLCSLVHPVRGPIVELCHVVVGEVPEWFVGLLVPCGVS